VHVVPFESNLQGLRLAIIGKAPNPSIVHAVVFKGQRIEKVLTIHDPMPTARTPM